MSGRVNKVGGNKPAECKTRTMTRLNARGDRQAPPHRIAPGPQCIFLLRCTAQFAVLFAYYVVVIFRVNVE